LKNDKNEIADYTFKLLVSKGIYINYCYLSAIIVYEFFTKCIIFTDCKEIHFSYQGNDIKEVETANEQDCQEKCMLEPRCHFWTWLEMKCQLKNFGALQNRIQRQGAFSGTANCPGKTILIFLTILF
jgi:hypothetical protein